MKTNLFCSVMAVGLLSGRAESRHHMGAASETDQNVLTGGPITGTTLQDLPSAVKSALRQNAPHAEIASIDPTVHNGEVVYEISFTRPGRNPKMFITRKGRILFRSENPH